jgi:DNA-binding CsgD family transcriptional regulator
MINLRMKLIACFEIAAAKTRQLYTDAGRRASSERPMPKKAAFRLFNERLKIDFLRTNWASSSACHEATLQQRALQMISERRFDALIAAIYDAGSDFQCWPKALRLMAQALNAPTVLFGCNSPHLEEVFMIAPQVDQIQHERYASYYHRINPIAEQMLSAPLGAVRTDTMMIPRAEFARTEFFNDFLLPQNFGSMLGAIGHIEGSRQFSVVAQRQCEFEREDIVLYRRLLPHLQRAVQLNAKLELLNLRCAASAEMLHQLDKGAFLVEASARVLLANREAERSLKVEGGLRIVNGMLRARSASDTAKLHALIAGCTGHGGNEGGLLLVARGPNRAPMTVSVLPFRREELIVSSQRPAAIVFTSDPDRAQQPAADRIKLLYGLTPAETAFAIEIAKGDGIQACADRLGISRSTARTHLLHIFRKTDTSRQAQLVRLFSQA